MTSSVCVFAGLVVEIGGVDQAGGVDPAHVRSVHTLVLPGFRGLQEPLRKGLRGRDQCSRTVCPGRTCAILSMSSSITTPMTG